MPKRRWKGLRISKATPFSPICPIHPIGPRLNPLQVRTIWYMIYMMKCFGNFEIGVCVASDSENAWR